MDTKTFSFSSVRRAERFPAFIPAVLSVDGLLDDVIVSTLSQRGAFVCTERGIPAAVEGALSLRNYRTGLPVQARVRVASVVRGDVPGLGVSFSALEPAANLWLKNYCQPG